MRKLSILLTILSFLFSFARIALAQEQWTFAPSLASASITDLTASPSNYQYKLTEEGRRFSNQGEISTPRYIIGGILGTYPGFGIGHLIQGRYLERGWIFTAGEMGSLLLAFKGLKGVAGCFALIAGEETQCNPDLFHLGFIGFVVFKVGEIIDVWAPATINWGFFNLRESPGRSIFNAFILPGKDMTLVGLAWTF